MLLPSVPYTGHSGSVLSVHIVPSEQILLQVQHTNETKKEKTDLPQNLDRAHAQTKPKHY